MAARQTVRRKTRSGSATPRRDGRSRRAPPPTSFWPEDPGRRPFQWNPRYWNWRRGFVRLWFLASLAWAGYWLYRLQLACAFWFAPWCTTRTHVEWPNNDMALGLALVLLSGPLLMLFVGLIIAWAIRGFLARRAA